MAIKKSELYSSLWASCDELRGGMDASQYKDYVLVMLFIKYISDRYSGKPFAPITIPEGASFKDMVALKGNEEIGDLINKNIIAPIAEANNLSEMPDFNNPDKLGSGAEMVKRLSNLIAIFENPALNFQGNRAEGDDILGDAYEYLMRHFATESGKSKGQFYTPAEVSRVMAKVIGIHSDRTTSETSVYDPTCGSGSLLLKVADEADRMISVFGQEMDVATASLARMNMILHDNPSAVIKQGNTLSNPLLKDDQGRMKTFDYVVANPPFSFKSWSNGLNLDEENQEGGRFYGFGTPPDKNGDYAFLLHIVKSLKSKGKGAIILPHGVLFRGNAEAEIRRNLIRKGLIKGIKGLPPNLFYGTGIPACLIILDKENAAHRKGIFMIDAGKGFIKDGNKNRLRDQDIHKMVDVFNRQQEVAKYSRMVPVAEIEEKEYNLNIPRYIDGTETEDKQDIEAHLLGGIPNADIDALEAYWKVYPAMKEHLFQPADRPGYSLLKVPKEEVKTTIFDHPEFRAYSNKVQEVFTGWKERNRINCLSITQESKPKQFIFTLSEDLLKSFANLDLINQYDVYQHLMSYWMDTMQDDVYLLVADGWTAGRQIEWNKKEFEGKLIPKQIFIQNYFSQEQGEITDKEAKRDAVSAELDELVEENSSEEGCFADFGKVNKATVQARLKEIKKDTKEAYNMAAEEEASYGEKAILENYIECSTALTDLNKTIKQLTAALDKKVLTRYEALSEEEIKDLVIEDKWMQTMEAAIQMEMKRISQNLTQRIKELGERYDSPLPVISDEVNRMEEKVKEHLQQMGFNWEAYVN